MNKSNRVERIVTAIQEVMEQVSGADLSGAPPDTSFFDHGIDSLMLTQAALALGKRFGAKLKLKHLAEEYPSCQSLASYLEGAADPSLLPAADGDGSPAPAPLPAVLASAVDVRDPSPLAGVVATSARRALAPRTVVEEVVRQQLALMARQLECLGASPAEVRAVAEVDKTIAAQPVASAPAAGTVGAAAPEPPVRGHGPQLVIDRSRGKSLTPTQEKHIDRLIERYTAKTGKSKAFAARNRPTVADPRTASGFKLRVKEMVYPIVVNRSSGCHLWDLDGNDYVDMLSGFGSNYFGFGAQFVRDAIVEQLGLGMEIGPQTWLVEEVSGLFRELVPWAERVAFCNTGSEAVLATLRLARTVTGRDLVVMFTGAYHGIFDEVVVHPTKRRSMPAAPGIPVSAVDNILVLPWASDEALEVIRKRGSEIAAVLVEPVQSRAPDVQPAAFLKELRAITHETGSALIFDEVVCGFRVAPGGAQEYFGIQADIASYGKVVGGGLSIGLVAGKREFMDALDGGQWCYGDASVPEVGVTYFAGTFVRHPVHMAAARASLLHMKAQGPELQRRVNAKSESLANELNRFFSEQGVPLAMQHFGSIMKLAATSEVPFGELLFCHLRERGIHVWDGRPCFLTDAHTDEDLALVVKATRSAVAEMQEGDFYPRPVVQHRADAPPVPGARLGRDAKGQPTWYVPHADDPSRYVPFGGQT